jgi:type IV pilus assembly protein PilP
MYKIYCCIVAILFLGVCFSGVYQNADASDAVKYISNRVKIIRPGKMVKISDSVSTAGAVKGAETKVASVSQFQPKTAVQLPATKGQEKGVEALTPGGDIPVDGMSGQTSEVQIREEVSAIIGKKERFYSRKGRIDPFEPFLRETKVITKESKLKRRMPQTPLEKMELSQLKLTAILRTPTKARALVQEASGKGYVISEGDFIGRKGGYVTKILDDKVIVVVEKTDYLGKPIFDDNELKLRQ